MVYWLLPVFLSVCSALSYLDVVIKYYYFEVYPRLRVFDPSCCVHRDRRPDLTVSVVPSPRFVLFVFSSFFFVPVFCPSWQASPLAASPHARRSREFTPAFAGVHAAVRGSAIPPFTGVHAAVRGSAIPPFTGVHAAVRGSP